MLDLESISRPYTWATFKGLAFDRTGRNLEALAALEWAFAELERDLDDDWLARAQGSSDPPSLLRSLGLVNGHNNAFREVLELAVTFYLLRGADGAGKWRRDLKRDPRHSRLVHSILQGSVAGGAWRLGWGVDLEPKGLDGKSPGDVVLTTPHRSVAVETCVVQASDAMRAQMRAASAMRERLSNHEFCLDIKLEGRFSRMPTDLELTAIEAWMDAVVTSDPRTGDWVTDGISLRALPRSESRGGLAGPPTGGDTWRRVASKLKEKAVQSQASGSDWLRFEVQSGMWSFTEWATFSLRDKLPVVVEALKLPFRVDAPAGLVISSPAALTLHSIVDEKVKIGSAVIVRKALPPFSARETIIVPLRPDAKATVDAWLQLADAEQGWLDWALGEIGHPPFARLIAQN